MQSLKKTISRRILFWFDLTTKPMFMNIAYIVTSINALTLSSDHLLYCHRLYRIMFLMWISQIYAPIWYCSPSALPWFSAAIDSTWHFQIKINPFSVKYKPQLMKKNYSPIKMIFLSMPIIVRNGLQSYSILLKYQNQDKNINKWKHNFYV